jgi:chitodextrinase
VIDLTAPATPAGLHAASIAATSVTLGWTAATDNVGVTGYGVQRDGTDAGTAAGPAFTVSGLAACTSYTFTVTARDAAGNASPPTAALTVRTAGCATAALFVAPGGSNANPCTDPALPCATFDGAFDRATAGDVVEVAGGTYAAQDISGDRGGLVTFRPATGATVTMHGTLSLAGVQHVKLVDFHFPRVDPNYDLLLRPCNGDVTLENSTGRRFFIFEGNSDITFSGGAWGGYSTPDDEDSGIGIENPTTLATCNGTTAPPAHNIVFDGVTFHDVFWIPTCTVDASGGRCVEWGASHPDCLEINGYVDGVTIRNSTFERCGNTMLSLYTDQGNVENVVVRNNTFRQMSPTSYYGLQWTDTTDGFYCSGDKFLDNSYLPNAPTAWQPNTPPRFECNVKPGGIPTEVAGNTFQTGPSTMDCDRSKTTDPGYTPPHVYDTNWRDNTFTDPATACSTP